MIDLWLLSFSISTRKNLTLTYLSREHICWSLHPGPCDPRNLPDIRAEVWEHHSDHQRRLPGYWKQARGDDRESRL